MSETPQAGNEPTTEPGASAPGSPILAVSSTVSGLAAPSTAKASISAATSESSLASSSAKPSGIKPPAPRIGRPCCSHGTPKAGPPPLVPEQREYIYILMNIILPKCIDLCRYLCVCSTLL